MSSFVSQIVIACANAGTSWTLKIQDKGSPAKIWVPAFTLSVPADGLPKIIKFDEPVFFLNGIDIVTTGGTPGEVAVAIQLTTN
jgi:hypothetical protein